MKSLAAYETYWDTVSTEKTLLSERYKKKIKSLAFQEHPNWGKATDRAYRIGQKKVIFVYKFVTVGTVEEKILSMQKKKQALMDAIMTGQSKELILTKDDFELLFSS